MTPATIAGQSPGFAGAVTAGSLVFTSGLVAPSLLAGGGPKPGFDDQAREVLDHLAALLARTGSDLGHVLRVEAFLTDAAHLPRWNDAFARVWTAHRPARTTVLAGLVLSGALIEVQAVAMTAGAPRTSPASTPAG
jgi:2-iminobutanoate/2-iminopropanoate deaminase